MQVGILYIVSFSTLYILTLFYKLLLQLIILKKDMSLFEKGKETLKNYHAFLYGG